MYTSKVGALSNRCHLANHMLISHKTYLDILDVYCCNFEAHSL